MRRAVAAIPALAAFVAVPGPVAGAAIHGPQVVVTATSSNAAAAAVRDAGGQVLDTLPIVDGVVARLPKGSVLPAGVIAVPDRALSFASASTGGDTPASTVRETLGLEPSGDEGAGVTVAVVDTGIAKLPALESRVVEHVDVTGTGTGDGFGHGTFMAGLIVGDQGALPGVAPRARLLDVKVAEQDGTTSLISVLRGLQVVGAKARSERIRVLNLSLASDSPLPYQVDPLSQALEALWRRGIVVVTPSGNDGSSAPVASPGNDPTLLTVGSLDENATSGRQDDSVSDFSARGEVAPGVTKPDVVAPGGHLVSLRAPDSVIDQAHPAARVGADYFRGSGTSMASAVTAGAAAAMLAERPQLGPDAVKAALIGTAYAVPASADRKAAGAGGVDLAAALAVAPTMSDERADRDWARVEKDAKTWDALAAAFTAGDREAAYRAWKQLSPESRSWASRSWASLDPASRSWASRSWASRSWAGADGTAQEWLSRSWASRSWASRSWASGSWTSRSWASRSWARDDWASRSWAGDDWASRSWASRSWASRSWAGLWP
jgi:serine protease AprX